MKHPLEIGHFLYKHPLFRVLQHQSLFEAKGKVMEIQQGLLSYFYLRVFLFLGCLVEQFQTKVVIIVSRGCDGAGGGPKRRAPNK